MCAAIYVYLGRTNPPTLLSPAPSGAGTWKTIMKAKSRHPRISPSSSRPLLKAPTAAATSQGLASRNASFGGRGWHEGLFEKGSENNQRAHPCSLWHHPATCPLPGCKSWPNSFAILEHCRRGGWAAKGLSDFPIILSQVYLHEPNGGRTTQPTPGWPAECTCNFLFTSSV